VALSPSSRVIVEPLALTRYRAVHYTEGGDLVRTCQPVQMAELAKSETNNGRN
jgi:hypothetical protein